MQLILLVVSFAKLTAFYNNKVLPKFSATRRLEMSGNTALPKMPEKQPNFFVEKKPGMFGRRRVQEFEVKHRRVKTFGKTRKVVGTAAALALVLGIGAVGGAIAAGVHSSQDEDNFENRLADKELDQAIEKEKQVKEGLSFDGEDQNEVGNDMPTNDFDSPNSKSEKKANIQQNKQDSNNGSQSIPEEFDSEEFGTEDD